MPSVMTAIADIINPEVLGDQVSAKFPSYLVLGATNAVSVDGSFPMGSPGTEFKIPFWKRVNGFASMTEGTALLTNKVTADAEFATVQRAGAAYEVYDTAQLVSMADPVAEIGNQIARRAAEYIDNALTLMCDKTPNTSDITAVSAGTMTVDAISNALIGGLGDQFAGMIANGHVIMHSKVMGDLMKLGLIQNLYQAGINVVQSGMIPGILGMPIIVSDRVTSPTVASTTAASAYSTYHTYVVGPEVLGLFYQRNVKVEFDRDILLQADIVAATVHFAPHLFGYDSKTSAVKAEDNKSIRVLRILSK